MSAQRWGGGVGGCWGWLFIQINFFLHFFKNFMKGTSWITCKPANPLIKQTRMRLLCAGGRGGLLTLDDVPTGDVGGHAGAPQPFVCSPASLDALSTWPDSPHVQVREGLL